MPPQPPECRNPRSRRWAEGWGVLALAGLASGFIAMSWRKWPDPLIDFGRELYIPWRLAHGAVLYRDMDDFYGPLSQYLNAGLFAIFGPGMMVLVAANLVIFAAIVATLYLLFRRAWGVGAALASAAAFIAVFGFSEFTPTANYNYATPYAHEVTHGFLTCLLLVCALLRWLEKPTALRSAVAGVLFGISAVLKPEILFAAGLVTLAACLVRWRSGPPLRLADGAAWALGAVVPTAVFAIYFSLFEPWGAALAWACRAWLSVSATTRFTGETLQAGFLGLDRPWAHLVEHAWATGLAVLVIGGLAVGARLSERAAAAWLRWLLGGVLVGMVGWLAWSGVDWFQVGRCFLGLALVYLAFQTVTLVRRREGGPDARAGRARLLIAVLAAALMARMVLNGRIYQFGFYQAALAGVLVPAVLIGELPERVGGGRWTRALIVAGSLLLIGLGIASLTAASQKMLGRKTLAVGAGADRFYAFPPELRPAGMLVGGASDWLRHTPAGQTVLVLPEGEMINYLARRPSPVAPFFFFSAAISGGREAAVLRDLQAHPPDWVVVISRDLREYGVRRYGEAPGKGALILQWVIENYRPVEQAGGDPLDPAQHGAMILGRQ